MNFKQLMLAPVAFGMVAPAAANAADINMAAVNQYTSAEQVTSVTQLSDVRPTDWAYQALNNLIEGYGCIAGYPNGTFGGGKSMTRYEAAAALNACLDRVTETTDELRRLTKEFEAELTVIRGRVASLEARTGTLEATQFSATTKLRGEATFALGGVNGAQTTNGTQVGGTTLNYDLRLNLDTSFTGKDLLRTRLRSGNFSSQPFGSSSSLFKLDKAETSQGTGTTSNVWLDRLYYQFPVSKNVTVTAGALVRNTEMIWIPSAYKSDVLDFFQLAGAPGVYNKATGAGAGVQWVQPGKNGGFVAALNYVAQNGSDSTSGVFNAEGALNTLAQVGYRAPQWGAAFGYRYGTSGTRVRTFNGVSGNAGTLASNQGSNSYAISAYWQPTQGGTLVPSVSAGYGWNYVSGPSTPTAATNSTSWFVGLQWSDAFAKGNSAGLAYGQPGNAEGLSANASMFEVFYKYRVSDSITVTPAIFYVTNNQSFANASSNVGAVVQTTFKF